MFDDLRDPRLLWAKGALMLACGLLASVILIVRHPEVETVLLLGAAIWGFSRAYYFAFYVIEHYVDGRYRFRGLTDFLDYLVRGRRVASPREGLRLGCCGPVGPAPAGEAGPLGRPHGLDHGRVVEPG